MRTRKDFQQIGEEREPFLWRIGFEGGGLPRTGCVIAFVLLKPMNSVAYGNKGCQVGPFKDANLRWRICCKPQGSMSFRVDAPSSLRVRRSQCLILCRVLQRVNPHTSVNLLLKDKHGMTCLMSGPPASWLKNPLFLPSRLGRRAVVMYLGCSGPVFPLIIAR